MMMHTTTYLLAHFIWPFLATGSTVQDVTRSSLRILLQENQLVLAAFTTRNLETLDRFHTIFENAAANSSAPFVVIDCDLEADLCKEQGIQAYPSIRLLRMGKEKGLAVTRYRGRRTTEAIRSFIKKYEMPISTHIDKNDLNIFKAIDTMVVVAYLPPEEKALLQIFQEAAERHYGDYVFGYSTDVLTTTTESITMPSIVCYKNNDGDHRVLNGRFSEKDIEDLLSKASSSVIRDFRERDIEDFMLRDKLTVYIFVESDISGFDMRRELIILAKKYEKYVTFAITEAVEYAPMAENFGVKQDLAFPALVVHAPMNDYVFLYRQGKIITVDSVEDMLITILQGKARPGQVFGDQVANIDDGLEEVMHTEL
ncbi:thioredoxin-like domain-containing protein [Pyrenochaeta sp. MPI-SDFR-AT-0127]|nr:thioredoxin-like domain-containing protein [Pyrenochaeta sp. MPI-SDFR-AT-0127]